MEYFIQQCVPDTVLRFGLRFTIYRTMTKLKKNESHTCDENKMISNELPTDFFKAHLGYRMKHSSCEWTNLVDTLDRAETYTLSQYQRKADFDNMKSGDVVLEIGCGWGSFSLFNARSYPHLKFESFSNSESQIAYLQKQIDDYKITNLKVWKQDTNEFIKEETNKQYSRILSIENCHANALLFKKLASILKPDGLCFFQILGHSKYSYLMDDETWMGRNFFVGGIIPSMHFFTCFNEDLVVSDTEVINGKQYATTVDAWLNKMYKNKHEIINILGDCYGKDAVKMYQAWRMYYLMCSESFRYNDGNELCVGYITMKHKGAVLESSMKPTRQETGFVCEC
jgi:cyclopropane-fatty-acyl-phospholipid synthase